MQTLLQTVRSPQALSCKACVNCIGSPRRHNVAPTSLDWLGDRPWLICLYCAVMWLDLKTREKLRVTARLLTHPSAFVGYFKITLGRNAELKGRQRSVADPWSFHLWLWLVFIFKLPTFQQLYCLHGESFSAREFAFERNILGDLGCGKRIAIFIFYRRRGKKTGTKYQTEAIWCA